MDKKAPVISVIMPSFNTPVPMLSAAVESILEQSFADFEFLIIDDHSTDDSPAYLASLTDPRIRVIRNPENMGITRSLNVGLSQARGSYIARMDSDDISLSDRLEKQLTFMESHPDVIVCGTWIQAFGDADYCTKRVIPEREYLRCSFLFGNIYGLCHPSAFFRADALRRHGITYDEELPTAQDYGMWTVCAEYGDIANVEEVLLRYRVHSGQISAEKRALQLQCTMRVQLALLRRLMPAITGEQARSHVQQCRDRKPSRKLVTWVRQLKQENQKTAVYPREVFDRCADDFIKRRFTDYARIIRSPGQLFGLLSCPSGIRRQVFQILLERLNRTRKSSEEV